MVENIKNYEDYTPNLPAPAKLVSKEGEWVELIHENANTVIVSLLQHNVAIMQIIIESVNEVIVLKIANNADFSDELIPPMDQFLRRMRWYTNINHCYI